MTARLKVLNVVSRLSVSGGIPMVVRQIIEGASESMEHHVCQLRPISEEDREAFPLSDDRYRTLDLEGVWTRSPRSLPAALRLIGVIRDIWPDVVHVHTGSSLITIPARLVLGNSIGWVVDLHEPIRARHSAATSSLVSILTRGRARAVAHTNEVLDEVLTTMDVERNGISMIHLGIDVDRFAGDDGLGSAWRREYGLEQEDILVVTVGRVSEMKGTDVLIRIAEKTRREVANRRVVFALVGGIADPKWLTAMIENANLTDVVRPLGHVDDLGGALQAADIYLTPSRYEGFGLSVVEAMTAGLPVIASDVGGLKTVVDDGKTGFLIAPDDIAGFAAALRSMVDAPYLRTVMGDAGRRRARSKFDVRRMVKEYENVYRELAPPSAHTPSE